MRRLLVACVALLSFGCPSKPNGDAPADAAPAPMPWPSTSVAPRPLPSSFGAGDGGVMNATPIPAASVAAMVNKDNLPPYNGPTGGVEGTIYVTGEPAKPMPTAGDFSKCPEAAQIYGHTFREGAAAPGGDKSKRPLRDAIVGVTGYTGFYLPPKEEAEQVTIEGCGYTTRTIAMTFGQRLEVKNLSKEFWTPKLEPDPNLVMMMAPPNGGDPAKLYPKKPGHYFLTDHDRKYVVVDLYVFLFPLHAASDAVGHYRIDGVPANTKLKLSARHPQISAEEEMEITVEPSVVKTFDFVLKNLPREAGAAPTSSSPNAGLH